MTEAVGAPGLWSPAELRARLTRAAGQSAAAGIDALLISPGPDLRYLTGYQAHPLERLTCLVLPASGEPRLVVPELEAAAAAASPAGELGIEIIGFAELDDAYALVASLLASPERVAVDDRMWAVKALELRAALPAAEQVAAGSVMRELRMRKSAAEVRALQYAGSLIDAVHAQVAGWLVPGRTENEVGADIAKAILEHHVTADFVIVGSGPNGASPHHDCSERVLARGDVVVVDIGGTTAEGYCSDSTRTYAIGEAPAQFLEEYAVLQHAQAQACEAARTGVACEEVDATARRILADAGLGDLFIHRTGHGIGLETHEDPYMVSGNALPLEPGMAFSVEPGFYRAGQWGSRIEDIVVCSDSGPVLCNSRPHDLAVVDL